MVYQSTKPAPNDDLDVSVTDIQQNFLTSNTVIDIDHYPFDNLTANKGYHKVIHQPPVLSPAAVASVGQLYVKDVTVNTVTDTQLFFKTGLNGESQLTGNDASTTGYQWIGGVLIQWGRVVANVSTGVENFAITFPNRVFSINFGMIVTGASTTNHAGQVYLKALFPTINGAVTKFNWRQADLSADAIGFYYTAIGN